MNLIHPSASAGFSAGAATYARGRPDYPPEIEAWLRGALGLHSGRTVVEVGAGTGKFTAHLSKTGAQVIAVEPVAAMRAQLAATLPDADVRAGTAEALALDDGVADVVVCAQAFHWFASAAALRSFHRVLRPGGALGLVWNVRDESVDWVAELSRIIAPYEAGTPRFHSGAWRQAFDGAPFGEAEITTLTYAHRGPPRQVIVDRTLSISFIAALPDAERARVEQRLLALIAGHPALRTAAEVAFPYETRAYRFAALAGGLP
ncbi:class I SAM-dependent methyltransferase [Chitinasiproducens palmae]|uniref:Methyltransferase domain-containing protein n=1 Tax=Chitinasiproducens palmae TaxID=1770053 RepID=A0A1H2PP19_9BURK|nr:class I SAM-dependent methyltransferase [Chitinasiproducens palmae]SDV48428.1 Methyltransferase domain-containing protein [Chitinasiproducens palmae]